MSRHGGRPAGGYDRDRPQVAAGCTW